MKQITTGCVKTCWPAWCHGCPVTRINPMATRAGLFARYLPLSFSDVTGDSAILEYLDGKFVIHHRLRYQMVNSFPV